MDVRLHHRADIRPCVSSAARGFTLVELMVVLVIVALLASLTLAGLSGVRQRAKEDKTRSTIRKIDSVIQAMYGNYATRRVPATGTTRTARAISRLQNIRLVIAVEMPDNWSDVSSTATTLPVPAWARNAVYRRYNAYKTSLENGVSGATFAQRYPSSETLLMIIAMSGFQPDCMEQFRSDEISDIDGDGAREFSDGWGRPIAFIRWPAGFNSAFIDRTQPDPLDVMRVTAAVTTPFAAPRDWAMTPLIYSAGPDEALNDPLGGQSGYGLQLNTAGVVGVLSTPSMSPSSTCQGNPNGGRLTDAPAAANDNITNYDLLTK